MKKKIVHVTSVHKRFDTRIFQKEVLSLADSGFDVTLVVADGLGEESVSGVDIVDCGRPSNRVLRMLFTAFSACFRALRTRPDLIHLHDPELTVHTFWLKFFGVKVIYDAHENVSQQVLSKPYLPVRFLSVLSKVITFYEKFNFRLLDYVVAATPHIADYYRALGIGSCDVKNYPLLTEFIDAPSQGENPQDRCGLVCYVGSISKQRGIYELVDSLNYTKYDVSLGLGGSFSDDDYYEEVSNNTAWRKVEAYGFLDRSEVSALMARSFAGLVVLYPTINYLDSLPVKMFEYMRAGIPVIASDFPLRRDIIQRWDCGVCVNPQDVKSIAGAIDYLYTHPERAKNMGENGKRAVETVYNWEAESRRLFELYLQLLK